MAEEKNIWITIGSYILKKSPGEILGYAFDVKALAKEVKECAFVEEFDFTDDQLCEALSTIIKVSANLLENVKRKVTTNLEPAQFEKLFKCINRNDELIYFDKKTSQKLVEALATYDGDNQNFALLDHAFILNRNNAEKLLEILENEIDPESEILPEIHKIFNEHRLRVKQTKPGYYNYFFDKQNKFKSPERRKSFLDYIFGMHHHYHMPITYKQAWQFIKVASDKAKENILGKSNIKKTDNIDLGTISWPIFFEELKNHNKKNPDKKIKFDLEPYQNRRILQHFPLELSLLYEDMFISKITNTGEKSIATGSRVAIAVGQFARIGQILSVVATAFTSVAVFVQSYLAIPILLVTILIAGKKSHHDAINKDRKHQKKFLLNGDLKITLQNDLQQVKEEIKLIKDKYHQNYNSYIENELPHPNNNLNHMNTLYSSFSVMSPAKAHLLDKKDSFTEKLKYIAKKLKPIAGPLIRGLLTGGALFVICMMLISTSKLSIIISGVTSLLLASFVIFTGYRNDQQKACARKIRKGLKSDITKLQDDLSDTLQLKTRLGKIAERRERLGAGFNENYTEEIEEVVYVGEKGKEENVNDNNFNNNNDFADQNEKDEKKKITI